MKRKSIFLIAILCLLLLAVVGCILIRPSWVDFTMDGVEMTADGTELYQRAITIKGWHFRPIFGEEEFKTSEIQIDGMEISVASSQPYFISYESPSVALTHCILLDDRIYKPMRCGIMWNEDRSFCVIEFDDRYFVGSETGEYGAVLELYFRLRD